MRYISNNSTHRVSRGRASAPPRRPNTASEKKLVFNYINTLLSNETLTEACQRVGISITTYQNYKRRFEQKTSKRKSNYPQIIRYKMEPTAVIRVGTHTVIEVPKYKVNGTIIKWRERLKHWHEAPETRNARDLT